MCRLQFMVAFCLALLVYPWGLSVQATAADTDQAPLSGTSNDDVVDWLSPITVLTTVRFGAASDIQGIMLAGLGVDPISSEPTLALVWSPAGVSWFGPQWGLHLIGPSDIFPTSLSPHAWDGPTMDGAYISLQNARPPESDVVEASLSYDPQTGATAVMVRNATTGEPILARGLQLKALKIPLHPLAPTAMTADNDAGPGFERLSQSTVPTFVPWGIYWRVVANTASGGVQAVVYHDRRNPAYVELRSPWDKSLTQLSLVVERQDDVIARVPMGGVRDASLIPVRANEWPIGEVQLILQHVHEDLVWTLGERTLHVGTLNVWVEEAHLEITNRGDVTITGVVAAAADGYVGDVDLELPAWLAYTEMALATDTQHARIRQVTAEQPAAAPTYALHNVSTQTVRAPFAMSFPMPSDDSAEYRMWRVRIAPRVKMEVPTTVTGFESWIRKDWRMPGADRDGSTDTEDNGSVTVMSYNIRHGRGMDEQIDLQRLADVMAHSGADVIGLNEVDIETERSGGVDQPGTLGELLGMHVVYGPNITYQGGLYGNALLSRYPVVTARNVSLPAGGRARWGLLHATLDVNGRVTHVLVTHLSLEPPERLEQLQQIVEVVRQLDGPVILMGDFNIVAGSDEDPTRVLSPLLTDAWMQMLNLRNSDPRQLSGYTFRSDNPTRRIDYVFINESLAVAHANAVFTIDSQASDHLPLVAVLRYED